MKKNSGIRRLQQDRNHQNQVQEMQYNTSDDSSDSADKRLIRAVARAILRPEPEKERTLAKLESLFGRNRKTRRTYLQENNDNDRIRKTKRKHKRRRRVYKETSREDSDSDSEKIEETGKTTPSSNVGPSTMERRYKGDSDEETEPDELPFEKTSEDNAPAKESLPRQNGGSDVATSAHLRGTKISRDFSILNNLFVGHNIESSGIASRTRAETRSMKQTVGVVQLSKDSSNESSFSDGLRSDDSETEGAYVSDVNDSLSSHSEENLEQKDEELRHEEKEIPTGGELKKSETQEVLSSKENEDEKNKAPEESEGIDTNLSDKANSGEGLQANLNGEREGCSPKNVSNEHQNQVEEKELDNAVLGERKVPSPEKQNGEKARKSNETNSVRADDAPKMKRLRKKSSTAPSSDQPRVAKKSSEAKGMNTLQTPNQSQSDLKTQTKAGSPALAEDKDSQDSEAHLVRDVNAEPVANEDEDCDYADTGVPEEADEEEIAENVEIPAADKIEKQVKKKLSSLQPSELFQALGDSVLGRGPLIETESDDETRQEPTNTPLPIKFRFEDEEPEKEVERTEYDDEIAALFAEAQLAFEMFAEASSEREDTQEARCAREEHELYENYENDLYCIYCPYVLEARHRLPPWAPKRRRKPAKKISNDKNDRDELPKVVDEHRAKPSVKTPAAFKCPDNGTVWDVVPGAKTMYKHQQEGFEFLWRNLAGSTDLAELKSMSKPNDEVGGCIISHAPGTGKTRLTVVFLESYLKIFPDSLPVVIAPVGMLLTWKAEFKTWGFPFLFHNLNDALMGESTSILEKLQGPKRLTKNTVRMLKMFLWNKGGSILGISYSLFETLTGGKQVEDKKNQTGILREILLDKPGLVILDEGHTARTDTSNIWNALCKLKTDKRVILSGTPFQNNFGELYNTLSLVRPAVVDALAKNIKKLKFNTSRKRKRNQSVAISETINEAELENLNSIMLPFVNVHKGSILQETLFGLRDSVIFLKPRELQKNLIEKLDGHRRQNVFEFEHKVALVSVHPYLLTLCKLPIEQNLEIDMDLVEASKTNPNEGSKTKFIIELLRLSGAANEKVLIFSQYIRPLDLIREQLEEVFSWAAGKQILQIGGKLPLKDRQVLIEKFNHHSSEARVMLASIKCCSEGISLVGASRVVLLDVVWNPSVERQAISRAYRIGQNKVVHTYHLMTSGTTEEYKYCRQLEKEHLSELVFCSSQGGSGKGKNQVVGSLEDKILEQMVGDPNSRDMFEKIINQPKESYLIQNFGRTSRGSN